MGLAKERMLQEEEQGWSFTSQHVCTGCVDDYALAAAIGAAEDANAACDFCGSTPAAELDVLLEAFVNGLRTEYEDALAGVYYDGREGGYQWDITWDTWDLVDKFDYVLVGEGLLDAVRDAMHDRTWVEVNFAHPRRDEALFASWERFCEAVQYETRYVFWLRDDEDEERLRWAGEVPAGRILDELGNLIKTLELLHELPAGYRLWRARLHSDPTVTWDASDLGTAPRELATQANRMSPAGIPMFYGAENPATAIHEVAVRAGEEDRWVTAGAFETSQPCTVVDFTSLRNVPSMFDLEHSLQRRSLLFLHKFVAQLSKPAQATHEQIDYVPTQIVTEYLLRIFAKGQLIAGLLYASAHTNDTSVVLDVPHDQCVDQEPRWEGNGEPERLRLGLVPGSLTTQPVPYAPSGRRAARLRGRLRGLLRARGR